jgi:uncharacterized glyoxalase superfamily protein PhnB
MSLTILLRCHHIEETRHFYKSVLGFNILDTAEETITVEKNCGRLIFTTCDLWESSPGFSGTIYFTIAELDDYFMSVKDRVAISWPIQDTTYGTREFAVNDCNGYLLAFQKQQAR